MKATLSYKSKRNIIIASVIVALLAGISTVGYFYIKGNDETARAFTQDNITTGEQTQTEGGQQGNPEQNPEQPLTPDNQGDNNGNQSQGNQNQGNQPNTNNNGTPNQENGQVPSGEFVTEEVEERTVLVSEDYMVEWTPTNILANTTTSNLGIVRPIITASKTADKTAVVEGEIITYTITATNSGRADGKAVIKDTIPTGTTFVEGSIKVNNENTDYTAEDLQNGIEVNVSKQNEQGDGKTELVFQVRVNGLESDENDKKELVGVVENKATVNEIPTEEVKTPAIIFFKNAEQSTVKAGEKILYTITLVNSSEVSGKVIVKDEAPENTTFVEGSIKINGVEKAELTEENLKNGIEVEVKENSEVTVTFEVTVNEQNSLNDGDIIKNTAYVNEKPSNETETEFNKPVINSEKVADKTAVVAGEKLTYTIKVTNTGKADGTATVKDEVPTGTEFVEGSIAINGSIKSSLTEKDLKEGIEVDVPKANENEAGTATVSFEVTVNKNIESSNVINTAKVNDKDSNEEITKVVTYYTVEHYYNNKLGLTETSSEMDIGKIIRSYILREQGKFKFVSDEGLPLTLVADPTQNVIKVYYEEPDITATKKDDSNGKKLIEGDKVEYTIDVKNNGNVVGDATVTDEIPEGLKDISFVTTNIGENDTVQLNERTITWNVKDLKAGETRTIKITATVVAVEKETTITNTVKVDGKPTDETTITVTKPIIESNKTATTILKRDNKGNVIPGQDSTKAEVGDTIIYTITATNKSDVKSDIEISDDLSNLPVTFVDGSIKVNGSASTKAKYENGKVTYKSTLAAGATVTLEFKVKVNEGTPVKTVIKNVAVVNGENKEAITTVVKKVCVKTTAETVNSLDMILVLDISGSMDENNRLADLKTAAKNLTNKLFSAQTDSTLTLIKYSTTASNPTTYQYDQKDQALKAIKNLKADGGTNFYKALDTTINTIGNNPNRNTIVVFLTDGAPTFYRKDNEPGNKLIETNSSNDNSYKDNLRPQIIQKAQELKSKPNTTIYSIGVGISGKKVQYVERDVPAELQGIFDGTKDVEDGKGKNKQTITYHYMKVKTYAEYLLNNIASSGSYINTKDINSTFDDIFKQATSSEHIYMTEDVPVTINIPETKTIISDIQVKIGNGTPTAYTLNELRNGIDGLKYTDGVGFTWTITDINTLNKELYISYTVQGIANN